MVEAAQRFHLALEACGKAAVAGMEALQEFEGDDSLEAEMDGAENLAHAAGADPLEQLVTPQR